jgi:hypothetical protein
MARIVLTDANVLFDSNDISQYITSISLSTSYDVIDTTGISTTGAARTRVAGLADNSLTIEFNQDFADNALEELINGISLATSKVGTTQPMQVKPTSGATSVSNPKYTFNALVAEWQPLSASVGELSVASVTWPISGPITKAIS